jgi:ubiquinone/menaquinone biosynthesis C-methylase UbiE
VEDAGDRWSAWLREGRCGGDPATRAELLAEQEAVREEILDAARIQPGEAVLDVGCGEGLVAFGALARGARVVFSDISQDLLDACHARVAELGLQGRCEFVRASAEDLGAIDDESVDVVTTRATLMYVEDKQQAFREFHRVLRPGGRISLCEQISRYSNPYTAYDIEPVRDLLERVRRTVTGLQPASDAMFDFDESDLARCVESAGFDRVTLRLVHYEKPTPPQSWETFLETVPNPALPKVRDLLERGFEPHQLRRLEEHLRPLVEAGAGTMRWALAFVSAAKPATPASARSSSHTASSPPSKRPGSHSCS